MWRSIAALMLLLPLVVSVTGRDVFRLPKILLFRAETIVLLALILIRLIVRPAPDWRALLRDRVLQLTALALVWAAVATAAADNHVTSMTAFAQVAGLLLLFALTYSLAAATSVHAVNLILIPAAINSIIAVSQALKVWSPIEVEASTRRLMITALLGNPNDIGMTLVPAIAVCCGVIAASHGRRRAAYAIVLVVLVSGIAASETLTAMIALAVFAAVLLFRNRRLATIAAFVLLLLGAMTLVFFPAVPIRVFNVIGWLQNGQYDRILSGRSVAFLAAADMARDHPIAGVGPGGFAWHYFDYAIGVRESHPQLAGQMSEGINFGEVHNDHLQLLAEYGVVGYALFLAGVVLFIRRLRAAPRRNDERSRLLAFIGMPYVASLLALMAGQFPLNLVTSAAVYAFTTALLLRWSEA